MSLSILLSTIRDLHNDTPAIRAFAPWPDDLTPTKTAPAPCAAMSLVIALDADDDVTNAIRHAAEHAEWRQTYTESEVGAEFLARYGYFELYGPSGHFHSAKLRGYIGFWDKELDYGWHRHEAEEIYYSISGAPQFLSETQPESWPKPGQTRHHAPWERHAMKSGDAPFLCYAVWKGPGLAALPEMST